MSQPALEAEIGQGRSGTICTLGLGAMPAPRGDGATNTSRSDSRTIRVGHAVALVRVASIAAQPTGWRLTNASPGRIVNLGSIGAYSLIRVIMMTGPDTL